MNYIWKKLILKAETSWKDEAHGEQDMNYRFYWW